jgi:hypothetical protein
VERIYLTSHDFELVVQSEKLHHKHEVHPVLGALVDYALEQLHALAHHVLLSHYLLNQLHQPAHFVRFVWIHFFCLHHPPDFVLDFSIFLYFGICTLYSMISSIVFSLISRKLFSINPGRSSPSLFSSLSSLWISLSKTNSW